MISVIRALSLIAISVEVLDRFLHVGLDDRQGILAHGIQLSFFALIAA